MRRTAWYARSFFKCGFSVETSDWSGDYSSAMQAQHPHKPHVPAEGKQLSVDLASDAPRVRRSIEPAVTGAVIVVSGIGYSHQVTEHHSGALLGSRYARESIPEQHLSKGSLD
jgi:hypothetical protein